MTTKSDENDKIRIKIEALLRLAEDPGTTEDERTLAMDRVYRLAEKHAIDTAKLDPHSGQFNQAAIVVDRFTYPTSHGLNTTRGFGVTCVLNAMGSRGFVQTIPHGKGTQEQMVVFATEATMDVLKVLLPSLYLQEANGLTKYIEWVKQEPAIARVLTVIGDLRKQKADPRVFVNHLNKELRLRRRSFCMAFYTEAAEAIRLKRADAVQEAGRGYELVLVDIAARIDRAMEGLNLRETSSGGMWSIHGWEHGTEAGRRAMVGQTELGGGRPALEG